MLRIESAWNNGIQLAYCYPTLYMHAGKEELSLRIV